MGHGFMLYRAGELDIVSHSGSSWGVRTLMDIYPSEETVVVILSNSETSGTSALQYKTRRWLASFAIGRGSHPK